MDFLYLLHELLRKKWIVIFCTLIGLAAGVAFYFLREKEYVLIIDEECDLIEPFGNGYKKSDIGFLLNKKCIEIDHNDLGKINWISTEEDSYRDDKYAKFRSLCNLGMLYAAKSSDSCLTVHLPISLVSAAKRVILISYRFEHSIMNHFVKMKGLEVVPFTEVVLSKFDKENIKNLIKVIDYTYSEKFRDTYVLSSTWYDNAKTEDMELISNIIRRVCSSRKTTKKDVMWTAPKDYCIDVRRGGRKISPASYGAMSNTDSDEGCWVACAARATNKYSHKWMLVHAYNRFPNQVLRIYLRDYGFVIDEGEFALSEMIQWIWRSRIRNNESIVLCIIPKRMKKLFNDWLETDG